MLLADPGRRKEFSAHALHGDSAVLAVLAWILRGNDRYSEHGSSPHVVPGTVPGDQDDANPEPAQPLLVKSETGSLDDDGDRQAWNLNAASIVEAV